MMRRMGTDYLYFGFRLPMFAVRIRFIFPTSNAGAADALQAAAAACQSPPGLPRLRTGQHREAA
jgi:hypothetical protein